MLVFLWVNGHMTLDALGERRSHLHSHPKTFSIGGFR